MSFMIFFTHRENISIKSLGSSNNLSKLLSDQSLSCSIHLLIQVLNEGSGVVRGCLHGDHSWGQFRCVWLLQCSKNLRSKEKWHKGIKHLLWRLLENGIRINWFFFFSRILNINLHFAILCRKCENLIEFIFHSGWLQRQKGSYFRITGHQADKVSVQ